MKFHIQDSKKAQEWIDILKVIKHLSNHITIMCTPTHMFIQVMDMSHVCLMDIKIPSTWFQMYESENEVFSVPITVFIKIFGIYTHDSLIEAVTTSDTIQINFLHTQEKRFSVPLMDIDKDTLDATIMETQVYFTMNTKTFDKYINELSLFGEMIEFTCDKDILSLASRNHEGALDIRLKTETLADYKADNVQGQFCTKYLQYISKLSVYPDIHVYLNENAPMRITFQSEIVINYFIAPKFVDV